MIVGVVILGSIRYSEPIKRGPAMSDDPYNWLQLMTSKSPESWISIVGGTLYVWLKSGNATRLGRAIEAGISGLISISLGPDIIGVTGYPAALVYFVVAVFGFLVLDVSTSIVSDKEELKSILKSFINRWILGKGKG